MSNPTFVKQTCAACGQPYRVPRRRADTSKFCSKACWAKRNPPSTKTCPTCSKTFATYQRKQTFCSRSCARKSQTGPRANAWKNGDSLRRPRAKLARRLTAWREAVYQRDKYTCQECGATGKLHAHHIKHWSEYPALRFDVSNGITLCIDCHGKLHGKDFSNRHVKVCPVCGATTQGRGQHGLCRSCSISLWHLRQGHSIDRPPNEAQALAQLGAQA